MGKGRQRAIEGLNNCRKRTPFSWKEFHPDNGTNLLNFAVYAYAEKEGLDFSRSRPYHNLTNKLIPSLVSFSSAAREAVSVS